MDKNIVNNEFQLVQDITYLNHAAVAPWPNRTAQAVSDFAEENATTGATYYPRWLTVEQRLREQCRELINALSTNEIALLKNTSEALSIVAYGLDWQAGDNIVISDQEFPSNRIVWESLAAKGVEVREADLNAASTPEQALVDLTDKRTRLLSISSVQYASGLRMDLFNLGKFCRQAGILFCVDAIQSLGALRFDVQAIQADFVMADGHKWMLGPEGLAVFYCRADLIQRLRLNQFGWHMIEQIDFDRHEWEPAHSARRFECGSPNMLGIHALSASLSLLLEAGMEQVEEQVIANAGYLMDRLDSIAQVEVITPAATGRYAGIVTFRHKTQSHERLFDFLKNQQVVCAQRGGGIRFSPHFYTGMDQLDRALNLVADFTG
jgi:cysteine desulfurase/selenocysteine lyase